jgi:hypothetical protein
VHPEKGFHPKGLPTRYINFSGHYAIPYRCFYSKNVPNLMMAGRDISVSKLAMASTRVMGTCAIGGQAVGTAAGMAALRGITPRQLGQQYMPQLRQTLLKEDCYIPGARNEDPLDMARTAKITASGYIPGYEPENVVSGVTRGLGEASHAWHAPQQDAWLSLGFDSPRPVSQVRLTFDPDLNIEIMISQTKRRLDGMVKGMPPALVKDFTLRLLKGEETVFTQTVTDNCRRLAILDLPAGVEADRVLVEVHATYGDPVAKVFEVRIY